MAQVGNALGVIHPLEEIVRRAHAAGALVLADLAQAVPHFPIDVRALDLDFAAFSAHKMLGPGGIGALYGKAELLERMEPWLLGGEMIEEVHLESFSLNAVPHRFEAGTPAIEAAIGWKAAVEYLSELGMERVRAHDRRLVDFGVERLSEIPHLHLAVPGGSERLSASVSFQVEGLEAHGVARMLSNRENVFVRSGFHCAQPLHESLDLRPTVRASFYIYNSEEDVDALARGLESVTRFVRA